MHLNGMAPFSRDAFIFMTLFDCHKGPHHKSGKTYGHYNGRVLRVGYALPQWVMGDIRWKRRCWPRRQYRIRRRANWHRLANIFFLLLGLVLTCTFVQVSMMRHTKLTMVKTPSESLTRVRRVIPNPPAHGMTTRPN